MRIKIVHLTRYRYSPAADRVALRLKLYPSRHAGQRVLSWAVSVNDVAVTPVTGDAYGGDVGFWQSPGRIEACEIRAEGLVETVDQAGVVRDLPARPPEGVFLRETPLTRATKVVTAFAATVEETDPLSRLHALMAAVGAAVAYRPSATDAATTATQALERGAGVCQDHAHVFIAAARALGIPARYVVGYILPDPEAEAVEVAEVAEPVEGTAPLMARETHAWAEASVPGLGWVGFDPTNQLCPTERYVRLVAGLDAADAAPVTGHVLGTAEIGLEASVATEPVPTDAPPQAQSQSQGQSQAQNQG